MRRAPRFRVDLPVTLYTSGKAVEGRITDLSLKGSHVTLAAPLQFPTSLLNLKFIIAPANTDMEVLARVMRQTATGIGAEFLDLDRHNRALLWDSLAPLLPAKYEKCPFCGHTAEDRRRRRCSRCSHPLDLRDGNFLDWWDGVGHQEAEEMVGYSEAMRQVFHLIRKVAATDVPVLVTGASGTGKEMVARAIHQRSLRSQGPFVPVNCGAIPRELLESELFGHEKGAFTGAHRTTIGTVERARGGTLFLDEVGELPLDLQVKLLRFLQEFTFQRVGGQKTLEVDLRVISATNSDLKMLIADGRFREDLYYRLDVLHIEMPMLRDREDDLLIMANIFLKKYAARVGKEIRGLGQDALNAISAHPWPGNVRELINRIRRSVVMADGTWISPEHLGFTPENPKQETIYNGLGLKEAKSKFEAKMVAEALEKFSGNVHMAAKALKTSRSMLYNLIQKYKLGNSPNLRQH